ncbi:MAG TPA: bifunctional YncE family protein/alkaline phosphatase family protein [Acidobacteriota bacterium]
MNRVLALTTLAFCLVSSVLLIRIAARESIPNSPVTRLPNGWQISPAGQQIPLDTLPLNFLIDDRENTAIVLHNGHRQPSLVVVDLGKGADLQRFPLPNSWLGLARSVRDRKLYVSGGGDNKIFKFRKERKGYLADGEIVLAPPRNADVFVGGLAVSADGSRLYAVCNLSNEVRVLETANGKTVRAYPTGKHPYACVLSPDDKTLYVSNWGDASVSVIDLAGGTIHNIRVGLHPNDMKLAAGGNYLLVANASDNTVSVIDLTTGVVLENIRTAITEKSPEGSTPNALALSPDGKTLIVANADNNNLAVIHLDPAGKGSLIKGFIPTGWYPTGVSFSDDGATVYALNGKGSSAANPQGPDPWNPDRGYIGDLLKGSLSIIPYPTTETLRTLTDQTFRNTPYRDQLLRINQEPLPGLFSQFVGSRSPRIKYVVYIIKENRTYDQVFGDLPRGNGDRSLTLFGEAITPNHHALANSFALLDNFYVDAEVSATGHNWSMGAYATDYVEKLWPSTYASRGRIYDYEGGNATVYPPAGYLWDAAKRAGITFRSYGEFIDNAEKPEQEGSTRMETLKGNFDPQFRSFDLDYPDQKRADRFISEFVRLERENNLPRLQIVRLPNDHTAGTKAGSLSPRSLVADNDLALGRVVEAISHTPAWKQTVIFVLEDDAQNGPDHVDAHRSICLVISPYVKRNWLDSTHYTTCSVLRTIELLLGLKPLSQYDAAARVMTALFTREADFTPYRAIQARYPLDERNPAGGPGARESAQMNFKDIDAAPDLLLNQVIWQSVHGEGSKMPAPVRGRLPAK